MLLSPFPANGGGQPARGAMFMKDTPTSLDMVFIGADHTIKHIVANTQPNSEKLISSGEPVIAVTRTEGRPDRRERYQGRRYGQLAGELSDRL